MMLAPDPSLRPPKRWGKLFQNRKVQAAAHVIAWALYYLIGHPATEQEIKEACRQMRWKGWHDFLLGDGSNARNCLQRNWEGSSEFQKPSFRNNAPIFVHIVSRDGVRWWLVEGFTP